MVSPNGLYLLLEALLHTIHIYDTCVAIRLCAIKARHDNIDMHMLMPIQPIALACECLVLNSITYIERPQRVNSSVRGL